MSAFTSFAQAIGSCNSDDRDLPDELIYVGCVDAGQRGVFGPIALELMLDRDRIELGPFVLPRREAQRLWRLLGVAVGALGEYQNIPPTPESGRGIAGWDLDLARRAADLAHGVPWEGETRP